MNTFKIGKQLRALRESCQLTAGDVAGRIGIARTTYALWEADKYAPPIPALPALANALDMTVMELMAHLIGLNITPEERLEQRLKKLSERMDSLHHKLEEATRENNALLAEIDHFRQASAQMPD